MVSFMFGQNQLELAILEKSELPTSQPEHFYLFNVTNNSTESKVIDLFAINSVDCDLPNNQTVLNQDILDLDKTTALAEVIVDAGESRKFYIKVYRSLNTPLERWNCSKVYAKYKDNSETSNYVYIKTFIPNPDNFN